MAMATVETARRYTVVAILLHWTSALCVLALIGMGLTMTHAGLAPMRQFQLYQWHKSVGITVLALTALRLLWRLFPRPPPHPVGMPGPGAECGLSGPRPPLPAARRAAAD